MCTTTSLAYAVLLAAGIALVVYALRQQGYFVAQMSTRYAPQWQALLKQRVIFHDGDPQAVLVQRYIWSGSYRELRDEPLNRLARRYVVSSCGIGALLACWMFLE